MRRGLAVAALAAAAAATAAALAAGPATISTVAGNGAGGLGGADGDPATAVPVDHPRGLSFVSTGGFLVAEPFAHVVLRVGADGRTFRAAGTGQAGYSGDGGPATAAQLFGVHGVAPIPGGGFVLADTGNNRIRRVSPAGTISTIAGTGAAGFSGDGGPATAAQIVGPRGIASLPDGTILFPDSGNHRVRRISPAGVITTVAGNGAPGFSGDGGPALAAQLNLPFSVSPLAKGGFLVADAGNGRVRRVAANGTITTVAKLPAPHGVAALPDGTFLVTDTNGNRVLRVTAVDDFTTVAGTGAAGFSGDGGPPTAAALNQPKALAVLADLSGFLVGDSANNRVRLVKMDLRPGLVLRVVVKQLRTTAGRPATLRFTLSERAAARLDVVRRGSVVLRVRQQGKAGANTVTFGRALKAGAYALRLRATAIGNRTDSATASLTVRKRR